MRLFCSPTCPFREGSKHRFGYFGYWDSIWEEGDKVGTYRNLKIDGELYNTPPTIEPIDDLTINENGTGEVVVLIDDLELGSSRLEMSAESSNPVLLPVEGIAIDPYGSERTLTITPSANAHGEAVITISVSDGVDQYSRAFTLTVNEVNDPTILSVARGGNGELTVEWVGGGVLPVQYRSEKLAGCRRRLQPVPGRSRGGAEILSCDFGVTPLARHLAYSA